MTMEINSALTIRYSIVAILLGGYTLWLGIAQAQQAETGSAPLSFLEYLILFIVISTPLLPVDFTGRYHLLTVAGKSVILFAAYKLILTRQARRNRKIIVATLFALLVVALKGVLPF